MLRIERRESKDVLILDVAGKVVASSGADRLRKAVEIAIAQGRCVILCNLRRVRVMDAAGVGVLAAGYIEAKAAGGQLGLLDPSREVMILLTLCGLGDKFRVVRSEDQLAMAFTRREEAARELRLVARAPFEAGQRALPS